MQEEIRTESNMWEVAKEKNRVSDRRAYYRKFIKPAINKIAA